jgi:hypothetical protein
MGAVVATALVSLSTGCSSSGQIGDGGRPDHPLAGEGSPPGDGPRADESGCLPDCQGKSCGDDGCGGRCGGCPILQRCEAGQCVYQPTHVVGPLAITHISRTPRYSRYTVEYDADGLPRLKAGTESLKRWPAPGEPVTYTAHVRNRDKVTRSGVTYTWLRGGVAAASGTLPTVAPGAEVTAELKTTWPAAPEAIGFKLSSGESLSIGSHDLTLSIWVEKGLYDIFNTTQNLVGTRSFEDWIQAHFEKMNERFSQARYPATSPGGILDRVRIDKLVVAPELDAGGSPLQTDPDKELIDGRWQFVDGDPTNARGTGGEWQKYVTEHAGSIDWGLVHEMAHQLGIIDLYRMNLMNDPSKNNGIQVKSGSGSVILARQLPTHAWDQVLFEHPGIMGGGTTEPYLQDGTTWFDSHSASAMNTNFKHRRGFYGEWLFDTPATTSLKITDGQGVPIAGAAVSLYQKDAKTEIFDNVPELTGTTDGQGVVQLTNRPVKGVTTITGHTLKANPFGQIDVVGVNGTMLVKAVKAGKETYGWLFILDLNLAVWAGQKQSAQIAVRTVPLKQ